MLKQRFIRWFTSMMVLMTLVAVRPLYAQAQTDSLDQSHVAVQDVATKATPFVIRQADGTFQVKWTDVKAPVSRAERMALESSISMVNEQIRKGNLVSHADLAVTFKETGTSVVSAKAEAQATGTGGVTRFQVFWWGFYFYISGIHCAWIAASLAVGIALSNLVQGILAMFSVTLPGAILQIVLPIARGIMGLGAAFFGWYARGNGVVLRFVWPAVPTGWWAQ